MVMETINVHYQTHRVGVVSFDADTGLGAFEYDPNFIGTGIQLSPIKMPLAKHIYTYPNLAYATYKGLPGLLADSLPDDFGNAVLHAWVASQGKKPSDITPLQRLQYTGKRGMGALEYVPAMTFEGPQPGQSLAIESLVGIAQAILGDFQIASYHLNLSFCPSSALWKPVHSWLCVGSTP